MKKNYKHPNTIIVKVKCQKLLYGNASGVFGPDQGIGYGNSPSRERNSRWDDNDDE